MPRPGASLWINLNRDELRSLSGFRAGHADTGAMLAGPTSRAAVIEFEQGRAPYFGDVPLGAAGCGSLGRDAGPADLAASAMWADRALRCASGCLRPRRRMMRWTWWKASCSGGSLVHVTRWWSRRRRCRPGLRWAGGAADLGVLPSTLPWVRGAGRAQPEALREGASGAAAGHADLKGVSRSTGRAWPPGTGTLTNSIWWRESVSWWAASTTDLRNRVSGPIACSSPGRFHDGEAG